MEDHQNEIRIAAVADIHCSLNSKGKLQPFLSQIQEAADILLICGDITDYGLPGEAEVFAREFTSSIHIPALAVLGNHDYESGQEKEVSSILTDAGVHLLNGNSCEFHGIGFAGVKGFVGGFGRRELQPWGEISVKNFVGEAVDEAIKLESALSRIQASQSVVLLHYAPVVQTVVGEPLEIYPFLGSSRLEEAVNRYNVAAVFHGHAHFGSPEGKTLAEIPVYNVALPVLRKTFPGQPPFRVFRLKIEEPSHAEEHH